jgi:hypothetical protein
MTVIQFGGERVVHFLPHPAINCKMCGGEATGLRVTTDPELVTCDACVTEAIKFHQRMMVPFPWRMVGFYLALIAVLVGLIKVCDHFWGVS